MQKLQRNYILEVEGGDRNIYTFTYPMTLEFNINRAALASANTASLRIYNLSKDTRKAIYKDIYANISGSFRSVKLSAGYGSMLAEIINGNIKEAKSCREEGSVNFITEIDCYDWSFAMMNAKSEWILDNPTPLMRSDVIGRLVDDLVSVGVSRGAINREGFDVGGSPYARNYFRADGNTWEILRSETNDHCFIDNGVIHCLLDDDYVEGEAIKLDSSTGLLSTPKKCESLLKIETLFEPRVKIGQLVELDSESESLYNGKYKVIGIQHSGIISGAVGGRCKTILTLNAGEFELNPIQGNIERFPAALGAV